MLFGSRSLEYRFKPFLSHTHAGVSTPRCSTRFSSRALRAYDVGTVADVAFLCTRAGVRRQGMRVLELLATLLAAAEACDSSDPKYDNAGQPGTGPCALRPKLFCGDSTAVNYLPEAERGTPT
jgi:hypothetical protein